jgi:hypothetical protein
VCAADLAVRVATQHTCYFGYAITLGQHCDIRCRHPSLLALRDNDVLVRPCGDLRQMRDREHLMVRGDTSHRVAYLQPHTTADTSIHLVED